MNIFVHAGEYFCPRRVKHRGRKWDVLDSFKDLAISVHSIAGSESKNRGRTKGTSKKLVLSSPSLAAHKQTKRSKRLKKQREKNRGSLSRLKRIDKSSSSDAMDQSPGVRESLILKVPNLKTIISNLMKAKGILVEEQWCWV